MPSEPDHTDSVTLSSDRSRPAMLAFHQMRPGISFSSTNYSPRRFDKLMHALKEAGFVCSDQTSETIADKQFQISFDDGYEDLECYLPELIARYRFRPIIFMPTDYIGQPNRWDYSYFLRPCQHLSREAIRTLSKLGVIFASHTCSHCDLTGCSDEQLMCELAESRTVLQEITGKPVDAISYPFGRYNVRVLEAARAAGYSFGYTMAFPTMSDQPLARGRYAVYGFDTSASVRRKLGSGISYRVERAKAKVANRLSGGTILLNRWRGLR